jgi:hypothetical protein
VSKTKPKAKRKPASDKKYRVEFHVRIDTRVSRIVDKATRDRLCEADDEGNLDIDEAGIDLMDVVRDADSVEVSVEGADEVKS